MATTQVKLATPNGNLPATPKVATAQVGNRNSNKLDLVEFQVCKNSEVQKLENTKKWIMKCAPVSKLKSKNMKISDYFMKRSTSE